MKIKKDLDVPQDIIITEEDNKAAQKLFGPSVSNDQRKANYKKVCRLMKEEKRKKHMPKKVKTTNNEIEVSKPRTNKQVMEDLTIDDVIEDAELSAEEKLESIKKLLTKKKRLIHKLIKENRDYIIEDIQPDGARRNETVGRREALIVFTEIETEIKAILKA